MCSFQNGKAARKNPLPATIKVWGPFECAPSRLLSEIFVAFEVLLQRIARNATGHRGAFVEKYSCGSFKILSLDVCKVVQDLYLEERSLNENLPLTVTNDKIFDLLRTNFHKLF